MFTLIISDVAGSGSRVDPALARGSALAWLAGRTMGDLLDAEQRATAETLIRNHRPLRLIEIKHLDERVLGGLLMHFMLETIIVARLLGVNAFDQPAVEEGKCLARASLEGE
jgi:glucose-6-phosphate isomerase